MNTRPVNSSLTTTRAALSPVLRRSLQGALTRQRVAARLARSRSANAALPASDSLTPATPALLERWFNPHLLDRLQMPLSRIRE
ncbi:MAG: hypothetical protein V4773_30680 [Verrucomicrobiota bacterium]